MSLRVGVQKRTLSVPEGLQETSDVFFWAQSSGMRTGGGGSDIGWQSPPLRMQAGRDHCSWVIGTLGLTVLSSLFLHVLKNSYKRVKTN